MKASALEQSAGLSSQTIYRRVIEVAGELLTGPAVDLGCGRGEFLRELSNRGIKDLIGVDGHAHPGGGDGPFHFVQSDLNSRTALPEGQARTVTAIEVIEHLENPRALVREMFRLLAPGGLAIVTTPNTESLTSLLSLATRGYASAFADSCYPAHITPVLQIDLERMLREAGFESIVVHWSDEGRIPSSGLHWQRLSRRIFKGKRFSDNLIVSARKRR